MLVNEPVWNQLWTHTISGFWPICFCFVSGHQKVYISLLLMTLGQASDERYYQTVTHLNINKMVLVLAKEI